jgi:hypothetical protein
MNNGNNGILSQTETEVIMDLSLRILKCLFHILRASERYHFNICNEIFLCRNGGNMPLAFWSLLFILSKYVELGKLYGRL